MTLDVAAELVMALRSPSGREALAEALRPVIVDVIKQALTEQRDQLRPLAEILGLRCDAARMRERRDPELRRLAVVSGRRRLYRQHEIEAYLRGNR